MNLILFIKLTFNFDLLSLVIIVVGQLLRFNIWSLALMNFMKSVASLIKSRRVKFIIKCLNLYVVIATCGFVGYSISLIVIEQATAHEILSCKSYEFITQSTLLIIVLTIFHYFAVQVTKEINSQKFNNSVLDDSDSRKSEANLITKSRQTAMRNIWVLLIWLTVSAVEGLTYSLCGKLLSGEHCEPVHISDSADAFFTWFDRFMGYQSWFIPLIWLYWPTKQNKKDNRERMRAVKQLKNSSYDV